MAQVKAIHIDDIPHYTGPNAIEGIKFHTAGRELGVSAWGMNVIEIEAGCTRYPQHDHLKDGQEEVYVILRGDGTLEGPRGPIPLVTGTLVRVGPSEQRKILPGKQGIVVLAIGGTRGKTYPAGT